MNPSSEATGSNPFEQLSAPTPPAFSQHAPGGQHDSTLSSLDEARLDQEVASALDGVTEAELTAAAASPPAEPEVGNIRTGRIANIGSQDMLIDFDGKQLAVMPLAEQARNETYAVGDGIEVAVIGEDERSGMLIVSRRKARQVAVLKSLQVGQIVDGNVTGMNKGGLEVDVDGLRGFIPASQVDLHFVKDISSFFGQSIRAVVMKFGSDDGDIILSRRKAQEIEAESNREKAFAALEVGQMCRGVVRALADYGAFVDIGGIDGLLHVSDMSWGRITKPDEVVKVGDTLDLKIIKLQREKHKVSLSLRQATPNPWGKAGEKYVPGARVQGRVVRMQNFGAFIELEPGIEGLLPISELSWTRRIRHPSEVVKEGDSIEATVLAVDLEKQRISLSVKQLKEDPWTVATQKFALGSKLQGKVVRTTEFGAFVELEEGIDGLIHISELSDQRVKAVTDKVKPGQEVEVRVISLDPVNKKIGLSMKPPPREPTPEELAKIEQERQAALKRREKSQHRRGGITIGWDVGLGGLDPSKFARD